MDAPEVLKQIKLLLPVVAFFTAGCGDNNAPQPAATQPKTAISSYVNEGTACADAQKNTINQYGEPDRGSSFQNGTAWEKIWYYDKGGFYYTFAWDSRYPECTVKKVSSGTRP